MDMCINVRGIREDYTGTVTGFHCNTPGREE